MEIFRRFIKLILFVANLISGILFVVAAHSDKLEPSIYKFAPYLGLILPLFIIVNLGFFVLGVWKVKRCLILSSLLFLICGEAVYNYFPIKGLFSEATPKQIKFMTYNVQGYKHGSKLNKTTKEFVRFINEIDADIVCMQEMFWVHADDKAGEEISYQSAFKKYKHKHVAQFDLKNWGERTGLAILSKYPIKSARRIEYNSGANASIVYEVEIAKGRTITIINNHLESNGLSNEERSFYRKMLDSLDIEKIKQTRFDIIRKYGNSAIKRVEQATIVRQAINKAKGDIIVCGDFNDTQQSYAYRIIKGDNLRSAYVDAGFGPGITFNSYMLYFRIDHILYSSGLIPHASRVIKVRYSDHYPVVTHFSLSQPNTTE